MLPQHTTTCEVIKRHCIAHSTTARSSREGDKINASCELTWCGCLAITTPHCAHHDLQTDKQTTQNKRDFDKWNHIREKWKWYLSAMNRFSWWKISPTFVVCGYCGRWLMWRFGFFLFSFFSSLTHSISFLYEPITIWIIGGGDRSARQPH